MVVILIVQGPNNGDIDGASPTFGSSRISSISNNRGERLSSTTNTTSVSFFSSSSSSLQVDPESVLATTKEEEWITKKKVELTTKKQIETRVKRQVVLEDGKVVEDSGPIVTTNTTEDTEKQEHEQTEHRQVGDDEPPGEGWVAVPNSTGLVKEVRENKVKSREETEERLETEDVKHLGDITDEAYLKAIQSQKKDLRLALRKGSSELLSSNPPNGRILHHSTKNRKVVDSEDTKHLSEVQSDGKLITETTKTNTHEEINDTAEPDDDDEDDERDYETHEQSSQRYRKTKDQEVVEYIADGVKVGEKIKFEAENVEGDRRGNPGNLKIDSLEWESLSERIRRMRREKQQKLEEAERMDALTKKPLNFDQEEETRKVETSKWLEHHFGSESRSSMSSDDEAESPKKSKTSTSFINVTMKSTKSPSTTPSQAKPATSSQPKGTAFYKGVSEWNGAASRSSLTNGGATTPVKPKTEPKSATSTKKVYELQTGHIKKVAADERSYSPFEPIAEKLASQSYASKYFTERASSPISSPISELESSPLYASIQQKYNNFDKTSSSYDNSSYMEKNSQTNGKSTPINGILRSSTPTKNYSEVIKTETHHRPERKSSMVRKEYLNKSWSRSERRLTDISDSEVQREPDPDYSPRLRRKVPSSPDVRSSPSADTMKKKVYQKTRFSADIPLVKRKPSNGARPERKSSSLGDTFRKFFGKLGSTNSNGNASDRKKSRRVESQSNGSVSHHSPSRASNYSSYQAFANVDNHIDDRLLDTTDVGDTSGRDSPLPSQSRLLANSSGSGGGKYASSFEETATRKRVTNSSASPMRRPSFTNGTQTLDRNYRKKRHDDIVFIGNGSSSNGGSGKRGSPAQKYYMGEDPFAGSIYGKEKEYDGAKPFRRKYKNGNSTDDEKKSVKSQIMNGVNHILGRGLSKSTSRLAADSNQRAKKVNIDYTNRGVQTLPRKSKKQVFINDPSSDQENHHSRRPLNHHNSNSMINVSVVNNGSRTPSFKHTTSELSASPQKPARTYRTSLLRSKSFNVQLGPQHHDRNTFIKSNPQLHKLDKLDESPPPLKSPGIVTSISRSTRDLSKADDDFRPASSFEHRDYTKSNGYSSATSFDSATSRRPFLRGLKTRTPDLYKTLHEADEPEDSSSRLTSTPLRSAATGRHKLLDYSNSFHSGTTANPASAQRKPTVSFESDLRASPASSSFLSKGYSTLSRVSPDKNGDVVDKSVKRSGSNDDYSETVRITSKSTDPLRPSVTNTVQSFSKKTVPSKDGRLETIESSETTRVTKSHYRGDGENDKSRYKPKNGSVIIEVRNERK